MRSHHLLAAVSALTLAAPAYAATTTIDFSAMPVGPVATAANTTISLAGMGDTSGPAVVSNGYYDAVNSLNNSPNANGADQYPTANTLRFDFTKLVSNLSFTFNEYGYGNSNYATYDRNGGFLGGGSLAGINGFSLVSVMGSGIARLDIDNGQEGGSWVFGVGQMSFDAAAGGVPEPATWALMILGMGAVGAAMRRRHATKATVRFA